MISFKIKLLVSSVLELKKNNKIYDFKIDIGLRKYFDEGRTCILCKIYEVLHLINPCKKYEYLSLVVNFPTIN
jgi:hypothetical protein